jgi:hypothetical protein
LPAPRIHIGSTGAKLTAPRFLPYNTILRWVNRLGSITVVNIFGISCRPSHQSEEGALDLLGRTMMTVADDRPLEAKVFALVGIDKIKDN